MSVYIIPICILALIVYATIKKINIYQTFAKGAKQSIPLVISILPYVATIMIAIGLFRISGLANYLVQIISPLFNLLGIPTEVCELVLLRPFTGSGSLSLLNDIFIQYGADSYVSRCAATILGSSETVFYVCSVYFASTKVNKVAPAIIISLIGNIIGAIFACLFCRII